LIRENTKVNSSTERKRFLKATMRRLKGFFSWTAFSGVYVFLYAPLLIIAIFSLNDSLVQSMPLSGFTTKWYAAIAQDGLLRNSITYGLTIALLVVFFSSIIGTYFAVAINSATGRAPQILLATVVIPAIVPGVVLGLSLAITFRIIRFNPGLLNIVIGHLTFTVPVVTLIVLNRLRTLDPSFTQASMDLGANRWRTFWYVTFPLIRTAILAAALLTATLSFDEVVVTFFLAGTDQTLPLYIWSQTRFGFTPSINAIVTLIGLISIVLIVFATRTIERNVQSNKSSDKKL
jgi:ABC-type spermidine/putrescine transport system permease subunit II